MRKLNKVMVRVERTVAYLSLIAACLGLIEKGIHYVGVAKRQYRKKLYPKEFGFQPLPEVRRRGPRS